MPAPAIFDRSTLSSAARLVAAGGLVAYPTEAVFGIGCDPFNVQALRGLLALKERDVAKGFLLIAADVDQLAPFVDWTLVPPGRRSEILGTWPGAATWILPRRIDIPFELFGNQQGVAVRVTRHPVAADLCRPFGGAIVSTSANRAAQPPAMSICQILADLQGLDGIVDEPLGTLNAPTPIREALTGMFVRF